MSEIKFRYRIQLATGEIQTEIVSLSDIENGYLKGYINPNCKILSRDQFTGLKDKNKKEVYGGDIKKDGSIIEWIDGVWGFRNLMWIKSDEIIGNIYENKDLLQT